MATNTKMIFRYMIVAVMTLLSRITGLIRDVLIAKYMGSNKIADIFLVATRIPNVFRSIFADGAFSNSFIPVFSKALTNDKSGKKANLFIKNSLSILFYFLLIFTVIILIFMPILVYAFAYGFSGNKEQFDILILLTRITFPFLLFISVARLFGAVLEINGHFAMVAVSPVIVNVVSILFTLFAAYYNFDIAIFTSVGFSVGGLIQAVVLFITAKRYGYGITLHPVITFFKQLKNIIKNNNVKLFFKNLGPGIASGGIYHINIMISTIFTSFIPSATSWLYYADRIVQLPLGIIGIAISTVLLPRMAIDASENKKDSVSAHLNSGIRISWLLMAPASAGMIVLSYFIISLIYERGEFSVNDTIMVMNALMILSIGIPFVALNKYVSNAFYANNDTKTPMKISLVCVILNVLFTLLFIKLFGFIGCAISWSVVAFLQFALSYIMAIKNKICKIYNKTFVFMLFILLACGIMTFVLRFIINSYSLNDVWLNSELLARCFIVFALICVGFITYALSLVLIRFLSKLIKI